MSQATPHVAEPRVRRKHRAWLRVLIAGFILWFASVGVLWWTQVTTLIPAVIFVGSFLVPATFTVWIFEREQFSGANPEGDPSALHIRNMVAGFGFAGLLGVVLSALLETVLLPHIPATLWYLGVAVIEETIKIALVWMIARSLTYYTMRDGMVLGACVGFGFAAFESAGYAFNTLIQSDNQNLVDVVQSLMVRGVLAPVGHGLWTALLAGALFAAASKAGRLRISWSVVGWWCVVVLLHWMWDSANGLAAVLALTSTGQPATMAAFESGKVPDATQTQLQLLAIYQWLLLSVCAVIGIILANRMWVKGRATVVGYPYGPPTKRAET